MNSWLYSAMRCRDDNVRSRKTSPRSINFFRHSSMANVSNLPKVMKRKNNSQPDFTLGIEQSVSVVNSWTADFSSWDSSLIVPADERLITSKSVRMAVIATDVLKDQNTNPNATFEWRSSYSGSFCRIAVKYCRIGFDSFVIWKKKTKRSSILVVDQCYSKVNWTTLNRKEGEKRKTISFAFQMEFLFSSSDTFFSTTVFIVTPTKLIEPMFCCKGFEEREEEKEMCWEGKKWRIYMTKALFCLLTIVWRLSCT